LFQPVLAHRPPSLHEPTGKSKSDQFSLRGGLRGRPAERRMVLPRAASAVML
jgi:hypothetical protein